MIGDQRSVPILKAPVLHSEAFWRLPMAEHEPRVEPV